MGASTFRKTALTLAALTAVLAGQAAAVSCTAFSATPDGSDAATDGGGGGAADGGAADVLVSAPGFDAAGCTRLVLDFEATLFPPPSFVTSVSATGGKIARSAKRGVDGGAALLSELAVPDAGDAYAHIVRTFALTSARAELHLSFDFTAPDVPNLYAVAGCELIFQRTTATNGTTGIAFAVHDGSGPALHVTDDPSRGQDVVTEALEPALPGFHHAALRVVLGSPGQVSTVHADVGAGAGDLAFTPTATPTSVMLRCGGYADSAPGSTSIAIDNVDFSICPAP